jgi:hypothetical protein
MFAFDVFDPALTIWQQLGALVMHLIPSFVLAIFLAIAWKWEMIGGIIFTVIGIFLSPFIFQRNFNMNHSVWISLGVIAMITFPFVIVGALFILSDKLRRKQIKLG